jgi:hypothetical protein
MAFIAILVLLASIAGGRFLPPSADKLANIGCFFVFIGLVFVGGLELLEDSTRRDNAKRHKFTLAWLILGTLYFLWFFHLFLPKLVRAEMDIYRRGLRSKAEDDARKNPETMVTNRAQSKSVSSDAIP